jgi:hypothetical protein
LGMLTPSRVRGSAQDSDSGLKSSNSTPQNPGQPRASTELRTVQTNIGAQNWTGVGKCLVGSQMP